MDVNRGAGHRPVLETWCIPRTVCRSWWMQSTNTGAVCLFRCSHVTFIPHPEASFQLQAVLSVPQNLSWPVWLTTSISCPLLIDFLSFTHYFQAVISSTWSLFLKTRNLLFTDHMLPVIISQFRECSQESDSGTRSDGLAGNAPSSCPGTCTGKKGGINIWAGGRQRGK